MDVLVEKHNIIIGGFIALMTCVFGKYWFLFGFFLFFNVADWVTGWMKSRMAGVENSVAGLKGVVKKLGYWLMILVAFAVSRCFIAMGDVISVDLSITMGLGWFVLANLTVNEVRSILENFVEAGFDVPDILIKGLDVANKAFNRDKED